MEPHAPRPAWPPVGRLAATLALIAALVVGQTGALDGPGRERARELLSHTLVAFAAARTLNGVISVIQGTELALQPAGMGVTLTVGELLDPINDLIERFSWLLLTASAAIGIQIVLLEAAASGWLQAGIGLLVAALLALLWAPPLYRPGGVRALAALLLVMLFVRFCLPLATVASHHFGEAFLESRRAEGVSTLQRTRERLEAFEHGDDDGLRHPDESDAEDSLLDGLRGYLDERARRLDPRPRIERLQHQLDAAVNGVVDLIVVFTLQALLAPLALLAALWWSTRRALHWLTHRYRPGAPARDLR